MKTLLSALILISSTITFAQDYPVGRKFLFGASAGLSYMNLSEISTTVNGETSVADKTTNLPVMGGFFEFRINPKLGIGLDVTYGYNRWDLTYGDFPNYTHETYTYSRIRIVPHLNVYYLGKSTGNLRHNLFSSFGVGYRIADFDVRTTNSLVQTAYNVSAGVFEFPLSLKASIAYGIEVNDIWFTKLEIAIGGPFLNLGTGVRF